MVDKIEYGSWILVSVVENSKRGEKRWLCKCGCGDTKVVFAQNLIKGKSTCCKRCTMSKAKHKNWRGFEDISGSFWNSIVKCAAKREIVVGIAIQDAWDVFIRQNRKCALSGMDIYLPRSARDQFSGKWTASLDRIDSDKGYILGNIQWVHKEINHIKSDMNQDRFIKLCQLITEHTAALHDVQKEDPA